MPLDRRLCLSGHSDRLTTNGPLGSLNAAKDRTRENGGIKDGNEPADRALRYYFRLEWYVKMLLT